MIKYFIRHYWRYLAMALAFATITFLVNSCEVNAESMSDSVVSSILTWGKSENTQYEVDYNTFHSFSSGQNIYLDSSATIQPPNYDSNNATFAETMYARWTICGDGNFTGGWNVSGTTNVNFVNTKIPCSFTGSAYKGKVTFANFEYNSVTINPLGYYVRGHIASNLTGNASIQFIAFELSFNQFPTYYSDSMVFDELDNILGSINNLQSYLSTINSTINANGTSIGNIINTNTNSLISTINIDSQAIINNNNSNTQSIIDKINELLEQNKVCQYIDKNKGIVDGYLNANGTIDNYSGSTTTDFINIKNATIKVLSTSNSERICFYNVNKVLIECSRNNAVGNLTIPNNSNYVRMTIYKASNIPTYEICQTGNQAIANNQEEINNNLTDSSIDSPSSDLDEMNQNEISNSVISDLLLLPLNMFSNIVDSIGGTCSPFALGSLLGTNLTLPCIDIESLIGSSLWGVIDVLFCGIFVLSIRKRFVDIFENITSLKDRGNELE